MKSIKAKKYVDLKNIYLKFLEEKKLVSDVNLKHLDELLQIEVLIDTCLAQVKKEGMTTNTKMGVVAHPLLKQYQQLVKTKESLKDKLLLYPKNKIKVDGVTETKDQPDLYDFQD